MSPHQFVYSIGILNLILAGVAIFCVVQAEEHPERFSLVYIAVSIFVFYMGTIIIIIILQIIETCQEEYKRNQSSLNIQTSTLTAELSPQLNSKTIDETTLVSSSKDNSRLSRSQTLPLILNSETSSARTSLVLNKYNNTTGNIIVTTTCRTLIIEDQQTLTDTHKSYQSFAFITSDDHD